MSKREIGKEISPFASNYMLRCKMQKFEFANYDSILNIGLLGREHIRRLHKVIIRIQQTVTTCGSLILRQINTPDL